MSHVFRNMSVTVYNLIQSNNNLVNSKLWLKIWLQYTNIINELNILEENIKIVLDWFASDFHKATAVDSVQMILRRNEFRTTWHDECQNDANSAHETRCRERRRFSITIDNTIEKMSVTSRTRRRRGAQDRSLPFAGAWWPPSLSPVSRSRAPRCPVELCRHLRLTAATCARYIELRHLYIHLTK